MTRNALVMTLNDAFFRRPALEVAQELLGCHLVHSGPEGELRGRIVEVEAYIGTHDLACHASKGRTPRTEVMFGPPGRAYVYLVYGMHHCFNVVTGPEGEAAAVLIRALEPIHGLAPNVPTNGPGRLCKAMGIDRRHNALPLNAPPLWLECGLPVAPSAVAQGPRIGVDYAGEWALKPFRFWEKDNRFVSRGLKGASK